MATSSLTEQVEKVAPTPDSQHGPPLPTLTLLQHPRGRTPPSLGLGELVPSLLCSRPLPLRASWRRGTWAEQEAMRMDIWRW